LLAEEHATQFQDPFVLRITPLPAEAFQQAARLVLFHDATYIVLCPGLNDDLAQLAQNAGIVWKNTPFVADSRDLTIITKLVADETMRLNRGEAIPAILEFDGVNHIVDFGRG
jgi:hypothetical protein